MKINVVMGIPCVGKTKYISEHRKNKDIVIYADDYQNNKNPVYRETLFHSFYIMLADIEQTIRKESFAPNKTIWIEYPFLSEGRRNIAFNVFKNVCNSIPDLDYEINLICIIEDKEQYKQNFKSRYLGEEGGYSDEMAVKTYNYYMSAMSESFPTNDTCGWDNILICHSSGCEVNVSQFDV